MTQLDFAIVGAQKCGTTALAKFLDQHPGVAVSEPKEVHLFDAEDFRPGTTTDDIDQSYSAFFTHAQAGQLRGEATPIYLYWPDTLTALYRYRSDIKLIVLLRDPVDRAISHYQMEKHRGHEPLSLFHALLRERQRLNGDPNPRREQSDTRNHSYRDRGYYSKQLAALYRIVPREQVLVLHMQELLDRHDDILRRVFRFLDVDQSVTVPQETVFSGEPPIGLSYRLCRIILKLTYLLEYWRIRKYIEFPITSWIW